MSVCCCYYYVVDILYRTSAFLDRRLSRKRLNFCLCWSLSNLLPMCAKQARKLISELKPGKLVVPEMYLRPPPSAPHRTDLTLNLVSFSSRHLLFNLSFHFNPWSIVYGHYCAHVNLSLEIMAEVNFRFYMP